MRPRNEVLLALTGFTVLAIIAGAVGKSRERKTDDDLRPSTMLAGPGGSRALLDAAVRMGISVRRWRQRAVELVPDSVKREALFVLDPSYGLSSPEVQAVLDYGNSADLVLAGEGADKLMRCFGYKVRRRYLDSVPATPGGTEPTEQTPWVRALLIPTHQLQVVDSTRLFDIAMRTCKVPAVAVVDTLLKSPTGVPVALRLHRSDVNLRVVLVADAELFRNRSLRRTDAGEFALGLMSGRYDRVIFEEYHHGFGPSGSLAGAVIGWSKRSPWGWLVWQLAAVGVAMLLFGAIRFGPARPGIGRIRRSPLEHVRALATALSAAKGHDVAIGAMVRGLRRRLQPAGLRTRTDARAWLAQLDRSIRSDRAKSALSRLQQLTRPGQPSSGVLGAAHAVEDLWEDLRP